MCGHCKHTGCWLSLCILMLLSAAKIEGQSPCSGTAGTLSLDSLTLASPLVSKIITDTDSTITEDEFTTYIEILKRTSSITDCPTLYEYINTFHATNDTGLHEESTGAFNVKPVVWIASVLAVVIISAVGLLGVAVVPLVHKSYYHQVIQFLVALAVGCLTGDAFLHLLPHAIAGGHAHEEPVPGVNLAPGLTPPEPEGNGEREAVLKGLVALIGIYFFFLAEKLVGTISEYRAEKKAEEEERKRILKNPRKSQDGLRRLSTFRESISVGASFRRNSRLAFPSDRRLSRSHSLITDDFLTTGLTAKAMKAVDVLSAYAEEDEDDLEMDNNNDGEIRLQVPSLYPNTTNITTSSSIVESEPNSPSKKKKRKHGHGHAHGDPHAAEGDNADTTVVDPQCQHGHSHEKMMTDLMKVPGSMASVAWMVIMGDGLHNFTDGMAIGVAFTASIAGGISTAVAVFCHELPHELGDFAVLLKTGMRIKEAMFFNVVSSILCFIGMIVGIGVGNIESASSWVFALTAGTFVYIALVDMLPELNSFQVKPDQSRIVQVIIQNSGLITGAGIMLIIALYEEQLLHLVG